MADGPHNSPDIASKLGFRFSSSYNPQESSPMRADLADTYKAGSNIRSKYKGKRTVADAAAGGRSKTSGIPIFGVPGAAERVGFSKGHVKARKKLLEHIKSELGDDSVVKRGVKTENSHALGHADFGTDHELSAASASKAQNTEQLGIEVGMRLAANELNTRHGVEDGTSLVHTKITDVLHPETGALLARRIKLIRRANAGDENGTVVFDHLMDGQRAHISKDGAAEIGADAYKSLMADPVATPKNAASQHVETARKGLGPEAPDLEALYTHQHGVLHQLSANRGKSVAVRIAEEKAGKQDRHGVEMVGPAFTDAVFPAKGAAGVPETKTKQAALDELRRRMVVPAEAGAAEQSKHTISEGEFLVSGSVPRDDQEKLHEAIENMTRSAPEGLGAAADQVRHLKDVASEEYGPSGSLTHVDRQKLAETVDRTNPIERGIGSREHNFVQHTTAAVGALRRMEADTAGSGLKALNDRVDGSQEMLLAAHAYRDHYQGVATTKRRRSDPTAVEPLLPDTEDDEDDEAAAPVHAHGFAGGGGEAVGFVGGAFGGGRPAPAPVEPAAAAPVHVHGGAPAEVDDAMHVDDHTAGAEAEAVAVPAGAAPNPKGVRKRGIDEV